MNPEIIRLRKYNNQFSIGIPKDVGMDLEKQHFEKFLLHCHHGVITLTPMALLNQNLEKDKITEIEVTFDEKEQPHDDHYHLKNPGAKS